MGNKSMVAILVGIAAAVVVALLKDYASTTALEEATQEFAVWLGIPKPTMIAAAAPIVLALSVCGILGAACFRLGEAERLKKPKMDIDPRLAFKNIINDKRWLKKHTETDPEKLKHLVSNYLSVRLDREFHEFLVDGKLTARGEKKGALMGATGPADWIPKEEWHRVEIVFDAPDSHMRSRATLRTSLSMRGSATGEYYDIVLSSRQLAKCFRINRQQLFQ
jgi:hypothetical protein